MTGFTPTTEQQAVVTHPPEPLRVVAGAGTGKTATVTARLAAVVAAGTPPEAALGITFTNKAAEELADRLRAVLAEHSREGREVEVTTYHGFAYSLLLEYGALVGVERDAQVVGPGYVRQLLFECLEGATYRHLDLSSPARRVAEAAALAGQLADNLLEADALLDLRDADLPPPWPERRELAGIVARFERLKKALGVLDYGDLIRSAHRLVMDHAFVRSRLRERYRVVVLDEYQDTAPAQRELLRLVFGDGFPITAVGDADQTIYEWRGASHHNFAAFPEHFPVRSGEHAPTLPLTINHRSGGHILEVAHAVRSHLHTEDPFDRLAPRHDAPDGRVEARWFRTALDEATWIASEARRLHDEEGVAWNRIAVLFRKNRHIGLVRDACTLAGVPVEVAALGGLLDVPEVADVLAWLRLLHHRDDTVSLARLLLGSRYRLGLGDLAPLAAWSRLHGGNDDEPPSWPLLEAIDRLEEVEGLDERARRRLSEFRDLYRSLLTAAQSLTLAELCRTILDALDAWTEVDAMEPAASLTARLNLYRFLDLSAQWSPLEGRPSLEAFLGYLELLRDEASDELDTARVGGADAVAMLTVHRAKGLEWDAVFLPVLATGVFPAASRGYDDPVARAQYLPFEMRLDAAALPGPELTDEERAAALRRRHRDGEWRTAYVAVTRARRRLSLSGAYWDGGTRPRSPSPLFEMATACPGTTVATFERDPGTRPDRIALTPDAAGPDPLFAGGWRDAVRRTLADPGWPLQLVDDRATYDARVDQLRILIDGLPAEPSVPDEPEPATVSVTGLVTLASCPLRYYWSEVDRLPRRPSPAAKRGVALHRRIELHNRGTIAFDDLGDEHYDAPADPGGAPTAAKTAMEVFLSSRFASRTPVFIETPIDLRLGDARVRGRIDAVYEDAAGGWEIVDYKSGRPASDRAAVVQLEAYAVAAHRGAVAPGPPGRLSVTFLYLGGEEPQEVTHHADATWIDRAEHHLVELVAAAQGPEFAPNPSSSCRNCDFLRFCDAGRSFLAGA